MTARSTDGQARPYRFVRYAALWLVSGFGLLVLALAWIVNDEALARRLAEHAVTLATGQPLEVSGDFQLRVGKAVRIRATGIRWGDSGSGTASPALAIEELTGTVDLWSVFDRPVRVTELEAKGATLELRWNAGHGFGPKTGATGTAPDRRRGIAWRVPVVVEKAAAQNSSVHVSHPSLTEDLELLIPALRHRMNAANHAEVSGEALLDGRRLTIGADLGPLPGPAQTGEWAFDLSATGEIAVFRAAGSVISSRDREGLRLSASLVSEDAAELAGRLRLPLRTTGRVDLDADLFAEGERMSVTARGQYGEFQVNAELSSSDLSSLGDLKVRLGSAGPSALSLSELAGFGPLPDAPYDFEAVVQRTPEGLALQRLHFETAGLSVRGKGLAADARNLRDLDLDLTVEGDDFGTVLALLGRQTQSRLPFRMATTIIGHGRGEPDEVDIALVLGDMKAGVTGFLSEEEDLANTRLQFTANASESGQVFQALGLPYPSDGPLDAQGTLDVSRARISLDPFRMSLGEARFTGAGSVQRGGPTPAYSISVKGEGADFGALLPQPYPDRIPMKAFTLEARGDLSPGKFGIDALAFTGPDMRIDGRLAFSGKHFDRVDFDLRGNGARLGDLLPATQRYTPPQAPYHFDIRGTADKTTVSIGELEATLGDTRLVMSGDFRFQPSLEIRDARLNLSGERLSSLGSPGNWRFTDRPFTFAAETRHDPEGTVIDAIRFESAGNNLAGRLRYTDHPRPRLDVELASSRLAFDEIRLPDAGETANEVVAVTKDRVFSDDPIPFSLLERFDANVHLKIDDLISGSRRWRNLLVELAVSDGTLDVRRAAVDAARGKVEVRGSLAPTREGGRLSVSMTAKEAMFATADMTAEDLDRLPRHAIDANLSALGNTPHELAASLSGYIWIIGGQGHVSRAKIAPMYGDFLTELFSAVTPKETAASNVAVSCDGFYLEIEEGKLSTAPAIVLQTEHVIVIAAGHIDLATENVDFIFETTPLRGLGISIGDLTNPFTKLSGTLGQPKITLNAGRGLVEGGAAVASGGLTLLAKGVWKRWFGSHRICERVGSKAVELRRERDPDGVPDLEAMLSATGASEPSHSESLRDTPEGGHHPLLDELDL